MSPSKSTVTREIKAGGVVELSAEGCVFRYERLKPGVVLITIDGNDRGQFGPATVDEVAAEFSRTPSLLTLFVDTRRALGPTREVMETWTEWFAANRARLERVVILIPPESTLLHLTVSIAQHLSRTGGLIRICGVVADFQATIGRVIPSTS
jgi:hypothetical protein